MSPFRLCLARQAVKLIASMAFWSDGQQPQLRLRNNARVNQLFGIFTTITIGLYGTLPLPILSYTHSTWLIGLATMHRNCLIVPLQVECRTPQAEPQGGHP